MQAIVKNLEADFDFGGIMATVELSDGRTFLVGDQAFEKNGRFYRIDRSNPNDVYNMGSYYEFLGIEELLPIDDGSAKITIIDKDEAQAAKIYRMMQDAMWAEYEK